MKRWIALPIFMASASPAAGQLLWIGDDPVLEAQYLAVYTTGALRPDPSFTTEIQSDLAAIRTAFPVVADIHPFQEWFPGAVWLTLTPDAYLDYQNGTFAGFDSIFIELGAAEINLSFFNPSIRYMSLAFGEVYHSQRVAELFRDIEGVEYADAEWSAGDGNHILLEPNHHYTIVQGFGDCPAGCTASKAWRFAVTDGSVTMLSQPGNGTVQLIWPPNVPEPSSAISIMIVLAVWFGRRSNTQRRKI
jgi:hypothetical protein